MELGTIFASTKALFDLLQRAIATRDEIRIREAIQDLQERMREAMAGSLDAVERGQALQAALTQVQSENADLKRQLVDRASYRMHELRPGAMVYAYSPPSEGQGDPPHYLCQNCYDKGIKSVLRLDADGKARCVESEAHGFLLGRGMTSTEVARQLAGWRER